MLYRRCRIVSNDQQAPEIFIKLIVNTINMSVGMDTFLPRQDIGLHVCFYDVGHNFRRKLSVSCCPHLEHRQGCLRVVGDQFVFVFQRFLKNGDRFCVAQQTKSIGSAAAGEPALVIQRHLTQRLESDGHFPFTQRQGGHAAG